MSHTFSAAKAWPAPKVQSGAACPAVSDLPLVVDVGEVNLRVAGEGRFLPAALDSSRPQPAVRIRRRSDVLASALPHNRFRRSSRSWQPLTPCCHTQRRGRMTFALC